MNDCNEKFRNLLVPVLSVALGLILGAILTAAFGFQPTQGYPSMLDVALSSQRGISETLRQATPLTLIALGFSVVNSAGFFNIGLPGQTLYEWIVSVRAALVSPDLLKVVLLPLYVILGVLTGVMATAVPDLLRAFFGASEVIAMIMMNYVLLYTSISTLHEVMSESYRSGLGSSNMIGQNASLRLPWLTQTSGGPRVDSGLFLAIITLIFVWLLMKKTTLGFEIRSIGLNPLASGYAGMSSKRTVVLSMAVSGTLAGLGGAIEGLGAYQNFFVQTTSLSIGLDGMAISLLGSGSTIGTLLLAILFDILKIGGLGMQIGAGISFEIANVLVALVIFFAGISFLIRFIIVKVFQRKEQEEIIAMIGSKPTSQNREEGEL